MVTGSPVQSVNVAVITKELLPSAGMLVGSAVSVIEAVLPITSTASQSVKTT